MLPSGPGDGFNSYVFPLGNRLAKGERLALEPFYLGSLFYRLDGCVSNIVRSMGWFYVVTHADISFLQLFMGAG